MSGVICPCSMTFLCWCLPSGSISLLSYICSLFDQSSWLRLVSYFCSRRYPTCAPPSGQASWLDWSRLPCCSTPSSALCPSRCFVLLQYYLDNQLMIFRVYGWPGSRDRHSRPDFLIVRLHGSICSSSMVSSVTSSTISSVTSSIVLSVTSSVPMPCQVLSLRHCHWLGSPHLYIPLHLKQTLI